MGMDIIESVLMFMAVFMNMPEPLGGAGLRRKPWWPRFICMSGFIGLGPTCSGRIGRPGPLMEMPVGMVVVFNDGFSANLVFSNTLISGRGMGLGPSAPGPVVRTNGDRCFGGLSYTGIGMVLAPIG
jgi:hypothetical protein